MANGDVTLTVQLSGTVSTGDSILSFDKDKLFTSIADVETRQLINIGTTVQTVVTVGTVAGATLAALNGLIVYNADATNFVIVGLIASGAKSVYLKVKPGGLMCIDPASIECDDDAGGAFSAFSSVTSVTLKADTAACKCFLYAW